MSPWLYTSVIVGSLWCHSDNTVTLTQSYSGSTVTMQMCYSDNTVVSQWCHVVESNVTMTSRWPCKLKILKDHNLKKILREGILVDNFAIIYHNFRLVQNDDYLTTCKFAILMPHFFADDVADSDNDVDVDVETLENRIQNSWPQLINVCSGLWLITAKKGGGGFVYNGV